MTDIFNQRYSSKSTAIRGAKRAGIESPIAEQAPDGKWYIVAEQNDPTPNEELVDATIKPPVREFDEQTEQAIKDLHERDARSSAYLAALFAKRVESTKEEIEQRREERREKLSIPAPEKPEKTPSYKEMARSGPEKSNIEKPVQYIHAFLDQHFGTMSRKEAIAHLVEAGINVSTCRTQYQAFKKKKESGNA